MVSIYISFFCYKDKKNREMNVLITFCLVLLLKAVALPMPLFTDVTSQSGIDFRHTNGAGESKFVIETVGPGVGFFDYDSDGFLDIYLINGAATPGTEFEITPQNALYRNLRDGGFADVTDASKTGDEGYGMGVAAGDYDNDGNIDIYLGNFGANVLYRNIGDGTFEDVSISAGVVDRRWTTSCAFSDVDRDGFVDLYAANYHDFSYTNHRVCSEGGSGLQLYCGPEAFDGVGDVLYRNLGNGKFIDVTESSGLLREDGKELGVVFGDVDMDGDSDLYLANDKTLNFLFLNSGDGTFSEVGLISGASYNEDGDVEAGMGVDMGDYDNDLSPDLFVTNFQWETNTLYRNLGDGTFLDETYIAGLGKGSIPYLSWGTRFCDFNNDGHRDIFIANGHLESDVEIYENATFAQRNQLFLNEGDGHFQEFSAQNGALTIEKVSRGAAFGDYDVDGDIDVLVANINDSPSLMRNDTEAKNHWIRLQLIGSESNKSAIGARAEVYSGGLMQTDEVRSGASFLSQSAMSLHFGLGSSDILDKVVVFWPSGVVDTLRQLSVDKIVVVSEGSSK